MANHESEVVTMTREQEAKIRREGFPFIEQDAKHLLDFIKLFDPNHFFIEPEIVIKLERKAGRRNDC